MEKILKWIKKNILGLEEPRRRKKKKAVAKKKKPAAKKLPVKKAKSAPTPVKKKELKAVKPAKNFKENSDRLLQVSKDYLKKPAKAAAKTAALQGPPPKPQPEGKTVGVITHFFPNVRAAIIKVSAAIKLGDKLHFYGETTDFKITVKSMQMNRAPIETAKRGQEIGIQVPDKVREGDQVFKIAGSKS